jgi:hypothetical protein
MLISQPWPVSVKKAIQGCKSKAQYVVGTQSMNVMQRYQKKTGKGIPGFIKQ